MDNSRSWYKPKGYSATLSQGFQAKDAPAKLTKSPPPLLNPPRSRSATSLEISRPRPIRPRSNSAPIPNGGSGHQRHRTAPSSPASNHTALSVSSITPLVNPYPPLRPKRKDSDRDREREQSKREAAYPPSPRLRRKGPLPLQTQRQWRTNAQLYTHANDQLQIQVQLPRNGYHYVKSQHHRTAASPDVPKAAQPPIRPSIDPLPLGGSITGSGTGKSWYLPRPSPSEHVPFASSSDTIKKCLKKDSSVGRGKILKVVAFSPAAPSIISSPPAEASAATAAASTPSPPPSSTLAGRLIKLFQHKFLSRC